MDDARSRYNGPYRYSEYECSRPVDRDEVLVQLMDGIPVAMRMHCPCGCSLPIKMMLAGNPQRVIKRTEGGLVDYNPSINRLTEGGCRSHFFIRNGFIEWV